MLRIYTTYIRPLIEYACQAWRPYLAKDINLLEGIQRRFTRSIQGMKGLSYEERITVLGIQTVQERFNYLDIVEVYKVYNRIDIVNGDLFKKFESSGLSTRTSKKSNLEVPQTKLNLREQSFRVRGAKSWNCLPSYLQEEKSLYNFKENLKKYLEF